MLIEHHTRECLDGLSPEAAQRFLMPAAPWLDQIDVRRDDETTNRCSTCRATCARLTRSLDAVADRLPETGARRGLHVFPKWPGSRAP